jgi:hypothetical protein
MVDNSDNNRKRRLDEDEMSEYYYNHGIKMSEHMDHMDILSTRIKNLCIATDDVHEWKGYMHPFYRDSVMFGSLKNGSVKIRVPMSTDIIVPLAEGIENIESFNALTTTYFNNSDRNDTEHQCYIDQPVLRVFYHLDRCFAKIMASDDLVVAEIGLEIHRLLIRYKDELVDHQHCYDSILELVSRLFDHLSLIDPVVQLINERGWLADFVRTIVLKNFEHSFNMDYTYYTFNILYRFPGSPSSIVSHESVVAVLREIAELDEILETDEESEDESEEPALKKVQHE